MRYLFASLLAVLLPAVLVVAQKPESDAPPAVKLELRPDRPNAIVFKPREARFVRLVIRASSSGQPCIDELEIFGPGNTPNLALAKGAKATASSCLPGYAIHQVAHLNDGQYGNAHSWIAATAGQEWAQVELPAAAPVAKLTFSRDRQGQYHDRMPVSLEVRLSTDGQRWETVAAVTGDAPARPGQTYVPPAELPDPITYDGLVRYSFLCERTTWQRMNATDHLSPLGKEVPYWSRIAKLKPTERVLVQMAEMIERLGAKGVDVTDERKELAALRERPDDDGLYLDARLAKRRLMFRDPDLAALQKILFIKRHPYLSSHNYSDVLDSQFKPGGAVCALEIPVRDGRLDPAEAKLRTLFDAGGGIARDAVADFPARTIYFAYRPDKPRNGEAEPYWHLMAMNADGSGARQLTDGPFHDYYPCPLPDGGLAFISTRCRARFICWRPQAFVLFRMDAEGGGIRPLSYANLSEWTPAVLRDGRILWTRSEYLDKGADFGHTLWATRPDGAHPELVFGNNTPNCYINAREVPGTREILCTLFSHGGDHNGPLGLIDLAGRHSPFDAGAITNITPDTKPHYNMSWPRNECWRDPVPVTREYFLASHAPADRFGLYVLDRYGNRELIYLDPKIGSMTPTLLRAEPRPPVLDTAPATGTQAGRFIVADVYQGLGKGVPRGAVKYIRVCQEVRAELEQVAGGSFRRDHGPVFQDFYATPVHKVSGPNGWPSYVAKGVLGLATVEEDGSAHFEAPAGKVLYFQALDKELNELQRMRSVIQLQPGEQRSCIGCHEDRGTAPPSRPVLAMQRPASRLEAPPWGAGAFSYEKVVQPVWNKKCVGCHDADARRNGGLNLTGVLDADKVPASYRTLISGGWVHYFDMTWGLRHHKAEPMTFGTLKSRLWKTLDAGHYDVKLTRDEMHAVKCWIDLNCPLWPDYAPRPQRPGRAAAQR